MAAFAAATIGAAARSHAMRELCEKFRRMSRTGQAAVLSAVVSFVAYSGTKPGVPQSRSLPDAPAPPFALVDARTNNVAFIAASTNAVVSETILRRGVSEGGEWINWDGAGFQWRTNEVHRAYAFPAGLSFGTIRRPGLGASLPDGTNVLTLAALRTPLGIAPEANWNLLSAPSRFWHDTTPLGHVFTWENVLLDRLADHPATIQIETRRDGTFIYRYDFSRAAPTNSLVIGTQFGNSAVEALYIIDGVTNTARAWRVDGTPATNGIPVADLFASAPRIELRWADAANWGDLSGDTDNDRLSDWEERYLYATDPHETDTDGDGMADGYEILHGTDPLDPDEDCNGIPDGILPTAWDGNSLWTTNAATNACAFAITLGNTVPASETASLVIGGLCIPFRDPETWTISLTPGEIYPYRVLVNGDTPLNLSIAPAETAPPLRGVTDAEATALYLVGIGATFDGFTFGGSGSLSVPVLSLDWNDPGDGSHSDGGEVCLHSGDVAVFSPLMLPSQLRNELILDGLEDRGATWALPVPAVGVSYKGYAMLPPNHTRFATVIRNASAHRCDSSFNSPYCSICGHYQPDDLILFARSPLTLKHDNHTPIELFHPYSPEISVDNVIVDIRRKGTVFWETLGELGTLTNWTAKIAGVFEMRGRGTVNGIAVETPVTEVEVQFPSIDEIVADPEVQARAILEWNATLDDCTKVPNRRREHGYWILLDTDTGHYSSGQVVYGGWGTNSAAVSVTIPIQPSDHPYFPEPTDSGAIYPVACFHTHTSTVFFDDLHEIRGIGPTSYDFNVCIIAHAPGIVYDYVPDPVTSANAGYDAIPAGWPKNSPAIMTQIPTPYRRPTP